MTAPGKYPDDKTDDTPAQLSITAPLTSGNAENLISEGDIILGDMFQLYRYENWFYQITMSGKEVKHLAGVLRLQSPGPGGRLHQHPGRPHLL